MDPFEREYAQNVGPWILDADFSRISIKIHELSELKLIELIELSEHNLHCTAEKSFVMKVTRS